MSVLVLLEPTVYKTNFYLYLFIFCMAAHIQSIPTGVSLWIGGHDSVTEGGWEWMDRSPFRFINWAPGEREEEREYIKNYH